MNQSSRDFLKYYLFLEPDADVIIDGKSIVEVTLEPVSSLMQPPTSQASLSTHHESENKSQTDDVSGRDLMRDQFGVNPEDLVKTNGKSAVKSIVEPGEGNNYVTEIVIAQVPPKYEFDVRSDGEMKFFKNGKLKSNDSNDLQQVRSRTNDSQKSAAANKNTL